MAIVWLLLVCAVSLAWWAVRRQYAFWSMRQVPFERPSFPMGNLRIRNRIHSSQLMKSFYDRMKGTTSMYGIFFFTRPALLVIDIELVKRVLIKDFQHFHDRGSYYNERDDPLSAHLFAIEGPKWRKLRAQLTPTFTSGKMKIMFPTIVRVCDELIDCLGRAIDTDPVVEVREILARFTTDVIGTCAFGIDCNSLKDPNAEFRAKGRKLFEVPRYRVFRMILAVSFPALARAIGITTIDRDLSSFFRKIVHETIEHRQSSHVQRNDFMQLLMRLMAGDDGLTENEIAAQAFVFFVAGFETSSTVMSYSLYELALNQDIQEAARREVDETVRRHNGEMSYEAVLEMRLIDNILNESMRKYPPGGILTRVVTKDYIETDTNTKLPAGTMAIIPVYAIHHDPELYPEPERFDPNRFSDEQVKARHPCAFIPFGEGPRICIGLRFGMLQARIGLAMLLRNYKFTVNHRTSIPLKFSNKNIILTPEGGLWLDLLKIRS